MASLNLLSGEYHDPVATDNIRKTFGVLEKTAIGTQLYPRQRTRRCTRRIPRLAQSCRLQSES